MPMEDLSTISARLKHFAKAEYGSVTGLCEKMGRHGSALSRYINGDSVPGSKLQHQLRELGCDIEWLMTGNGIPTKDKEAVLAQSKEVAQQLERVTEDYEMTKDALKLALRDNHEKARIIEELRRMLASREVGTDKAVVSKF